MNKINILLFDGSQDTPRLMTIEDDVQTFRKVIGCDTFEGYTATELGRKYGLDIYLDGDGKIRPDKPKLVGLFIREDTGKVVDTLVGNLLMCCHDEEGDSTSVVPGIENVLARYHIKARKETNIPDTWRDGFGEFQASPYLLLLYC